MAIKPPAEECHHGIRTWACALIAACVTLGSVASADVSVVFTKDEIAVINDYYARYPMDAGAGKQKKNKGLPPGIARISRAASRCPRALRSSSCRTT